MSDVRGSLLHGAMFSECQVYRYGLWRIWDADTPPAMFVGLNPSTADENADDPTIRRCIDFARQWGHGGLLMGNLFAFRATDPRVMKAAAEPVGADNDGLLERMATAAAVVIAAWGVHGTHRGRAQQVTEAGVLGDFNVLRLTKDGHPGHPLYLPKTSRPFNPQALEAAA